VTAQVKLYCYCFTSCHCYVAYCSDSRMFTRSLPSRQCAAGFRFNIIHQNTYISKHIKLNIYL